MRQVNEGSLASVRSRMLGLDIYKKIAEDVADLPTKLCYIWDLPSPTAEGGIFLTIFPKNRAAKELWKQQKIRLSGEKRNGKRRKSHGI